MIFQNFIIHKGKIRKIELRKYKKFNYQLEKIT